jgi:hypothetical protein
MMLKPRDVVAWTLAIFFSLLCVIAGVSLAHDVWIGDFPRVRALFAISRTLALTCSVIGVAVVGASFVVFLLQSYRGQIEFSLLGVKVKGVAGPPVMWVLVFLSIAAVMTIILRLTWVR